jgi:ketosteroid isomerase-like protein/GNAT superfamily N-acetyltransferase
MAGPGKAGLAVAHRLYDALNGGEWDEFFGMLHPEIEVREEFLGPDAAVYRGRDGAREWLRRSSEAMSDFRWEPLRFMRLQDALVIPVRLSARGAGSGARVSADLVHIGRMRDGRLSLIAAYPDLQSAIAAVGTGITVEPEPFDSPDAAALLAAVQAELIERYSGDAERGAKPSGENIAAFFVARNRDGEAVGCGALRDLQDGAVEIKRMYVRPSDRGRGLSWVILIALEAEAQRREFGIVRLETGEFSPEAMSLYRAAGYREIPCYGAYDGPVSRCFERRLVA